MKKQFYGLSICRDKLINGGDIDLARRHYIGEEEIKRMKVTVLVDTGSLILAINENIQEQLQLPVVDKRKAQMADGRIIEFDVVAG